MTPRPLPVRRRAHSHDKKRANPALRCPGLAQGGLGCPPGAGSGTAGRGTRPWSGRGTAPRAAAAPRPGKRSYTEAPLTKSFIRIAF